MGGSSYEHEHRYFEYVVATGTSPNLPHMLQSNELEATMWSHMVDLNLKADERPPAFRKGCPSLSSKAIDEVTGTQSPKLQQIQYVEALVRDIEARSDYGSGDA